MYELKTKPSDISIQTVIQSISSSKKQAEARMLLEIFNRATLQKPIVWGAKFIGYGVFHYQTKSGGEKAIYAMGFSVTDKKITLHLNLADKTVQNCLNQLGRHKRSISCLYLNKLEDVDLTVLEKMIHQAWLSQ